MAEFLLSQGKSAVRNSELLSKLASSPKAKPCIAGRKATDDQLFNESPIFPCVSDTFADQSDSVLEMVDNLSPERHRTLQSAERIVQLYRKAENGAACSVKMWEHLHDLSTAICGELKLYGEKLKKHVEKRRRGILAGFADRSVAESVANILASIGEMYLGFDRAMEKLEEQMVDKMRLEASPEQLHEQYRTSVTRLEHLCDHIRRNVLDPKSDLASGQQSAESELGKGIMACDDITRRAQHCGIRFRLKFAKQFHALVVQQTVQVTLLQSLGIFVPSTREIVEKASDGFERNPGPASIPILLPKKEEEKKEPCSSQRDTTRDEEPAEEIPREKLGQGIPQRVKRYKLFPRIKREQTIKRWRSSKTVDIVGPPTEEKFSTFYYASKETAEPATEPRTMVRAPTDGSPRNSPKNATEDWWNRLFNAFYQTWARSSLFSVSSLCVRT